MGHAGEGPANRDHRDGVERVVTWVRAGLWPLQSHLGGVGGSVKASGGTEMDRLEVIGTRWGRWGRCSAVGGGAQDGSWRLWTWKPCR